MSYLCFFFKITLCNNVNIIHVFYIYSTAVVLATILCNRFSIAIVEPGWAVVLAIGIVLGNRPAMFTEAYH